MKRSALVALVWSAVALADGGLQLGSSYSRSSTESARSGLIEMKLGGLVPLIDREKGLSGTPFADTFGAHASMLLGELEYDLEIWQGFGTISAAVSAGYTEKYASATLNIGGTQTASDERTALMLIPVRALATYRFDWLLSRYQFPLVPYVKAGLGYTAWWATKGGNIQVVDNAKAQGGKWGYALTGGLSLAVDFLEPRLAKDFDTDLGVNHTYVFAEFVYENVNNFGAPGLDLSSRHAMFGLAFEF